MPTSNISVPLPMFFWINGSGGGVLGADDATLPVEFFALRIMVALAYGLVGAIGLLGNLAVLWVLGNCGARRVSGPPSDTFIFSLALADLGLALTLPFWAAESALDFHWPFGSALCKMILTATVLNVYASIFLITALSVASNSCLNPVLYCLLRREPRQALADTFRDLRSRLWPQGPGWL